MLCSCEQDAQPHKSMNACDLITQNICQLYSLTPPCTYKQNVLFTCNISIFEPYAHVLCRYTYSHQQLGCALTQHWYIPPHIHTATRTNTNTCIHTHARTYVQSTSSRTFNKPPTDIHCTQGAYTCSHPNNIFEYLNARFDADSCHWNYWRYLRCMNVSIDNIHQATSDIAVLDEMRDQPRLRFSCEGCMTGWC